MYPVTEDIVNLFQNGGRQLARIVFSGNGQEFVIDESDIVQGGLTIDRYSMTGNKIELGTAISSELTLKLRNYDGNFDDVNFEGAELYVQIGVKDWSDPDSEATYIPCGYFIIDEPPRTLSTITISALDRMVKFAKWVNMNLLVFPITIENLVKAVCRICGVTLKTDLTTLPNYDWVVESTFTGDGVTYQSIIQWCAYVMGACAYVDYDGELVFSWYQNSGFVIPPSVRYHSDLLENDIQVTGLLYRNQQNQEYLFGANDYAIENQSNILLQNNINQALSPIWNVVNGFRYRPFTANMKPAPFLYPMDGVIFVDKGGNRVNSYVTHITYTMNGACTVSAKGETAKREEMKVTRLTPQQMAMIQQMENAIPTVASQLITAALTGYVIIRPDEILIMDTDDPETAKNVWRWNLGGLGYSHSDVAGGAYDGVYTVALGMNGEFVADFIRSGTLVLGGGSGKDGAMSVLNDDDDEICRIDKNGADITGNIYSRNSTSGYWTRMYDSAVFGGITVGGEEVEVSRISMTAFVDDVRGLRIDGDHIFLVSGGLYISDRDGTASAHQGATKTVNVMTGDSSQTQNVAVVDSFDSETGELHLSSATVPLMGGTTSSLQFFHGLCVQ